jgi:hypothetical protein
MVKLCSPFVLSGVVDSLSKWHGRGPCHEVEASQTNDVWQGWVCEARANGSFTPSSLLCYTSAILYRRLALRISLPVFIPERSARQSRPAAGIAVVGVIAAQRG